MNLMITIHPSSELRWWYYKSKLIPESGKFISYSGVKVPCPNQVKIGKDTSINHGVLFDACGSKSIIIGEKCLIGPYVVIRSADHIFNDISRPIREQGHIYGNIIIEDDCWIGSHVTVTKNVKIGKGSVIGANSVVTKDIPPFSVAMGVPARVVRSRLGKSDDHERRRDTPAKTF